MKQLIISAIFALLSLTAYSQTYTVQYTPASHNPRLISLSLSFGSYMMDNVIIDSGSTTTQLNYNDYVYLKNNGYLSSDNFIGHVKTRSCNGVLTTKPKYRLNSIKLGNIILRDVEVIFDIVNRNNTTRLLGLNFLNMFSSFNVDFKSQTLQLTV